MQMTGTSCRSFTFDVHFSFNSYTPEMHTEASLTASGIHKRKKSSALRTDAGGQGLGFACIDDVNLLNLDCCASLG